jgi:magnesium chelatase family protein
MLASLNTMVINGIEATPVKVEVDIQTGLPAFDKVGRKVGMDIKEFRCF